MAAQLAAQEAEHRADVLQVDPGGEEPPVVPDEDGLLVDLGEGAPLADPVVDGILVDLVVHEVLVARVVNETLLGLVADDTLVDLVANVHPGERSASGPLADLDEGAGQVTNGHLVALAADEDLVV